MKWEDVRDLYPGKFIKFEIVESHAKDGKEYIDEIAIISVINDGKEAMKEFVHCKPGQLVYSTNNEQLIIQLVKHVGIRRSVQGE